MNASFPPAAGTPGNAYDLIAGQWHSSPRRFLARRYVDALVRGLEPGSRVLDLGCGTGAPIACDLIQRGFEVVGVDQSAKMLEIAKDVIPEARLIHADMRRLDIAGLFDAAVAWDSVFHLPREDHPAVFRMVFSRLRPGGSLLLSAGGSAHEGFTSEMYGQSFFYSGYEPEDTRRLLEAEGFAIELCEVDDPTPRGHIAIVARHP